MTNPFNKVHRLKSLQKPSPQRNTAVEVFGTVPVALPAVGDVVVFRWGDPTLIGGPIIPMPLIVTGISAEGRINGRIVTDPLLRGQGPGGTPAALPDLLPVINSPYSTQPVPLSWHWPREVFPATFTEET